MRVLHYLLEQQDLPLSLEKQILYEFLIVINILQVVNGPTTVIRDYILKKLFTYFIKITTIDTLYNGVYLHVHIKINLFFLLILLEMCIMSRPETELIRRDPHERAYWIGFLSAQCRFYFFPRFYFYF